MKGWPYTECLAVLFVGVLLAFPLLYLTHTGNIKGIDYSEEQNQVPDHNEQHHVEQWEAFMDIRCSHSPESIFIHHEDELVYEFKEHESQKVFDTEIIFNVEHGFAEFSVSVNWPEGIKGYVECSIEPDGQVTRKAGAWGSGQQVSILEFKWPHHH